MYILARILKNETLRYLFVTRCFDIPSLPYTIYNSVVSLLIVNIALYFNSTYSNYILLYHKYKMHSHSYKHTTKCIICREKILLLLFHHTTYLVINIYICLKYIFQTDARFPPHIYAVYKIYIFLFVASLYITYIMCCCLALNM